MKSQLYLKYFLTGFLILTGFWALVWCLYYFLGTSLIESAYDGKSLDFLNKLIQERGANDVEFYDDLLRFKLFKYTVITFAVFGLWFAAAFLISKAGYAFLLFSVLSSFLLLECLLLILYHNPVILNSMPSMKEPLRHYYGFYGRDTIQLNPECSVYNPNLTYTLRPGNCRYKNIEFDTEYSINSAGLRDDESSLDSPEIIAIGDSFTMGWGVEQNETFAEVLGRRLDMKVLNAGISSYGTVREMWLLNRLDTSNLKYLIIQYINNDMDENRPYYKKQKLNIKSREEFSQIVENHQNRQKYYLGKMSHRVLEKLLKDFKLLLTSWRKRPEQYIIDEGEAFVFALSNNYEGGLEGVQVIVVETEMFCENDSDFIESVQKAIKKGDYPEFIKNAKFVDLTGMLRKQDHCYILDDHMNAEGHIIVAEAILEQVSLD